MEKTEKKDKCFEFYFDYVFVSHEITIFTAKRSLTSKRETPKFDCRPER